MLLEAGLPSVPSSSGPIEEDTHKKAGRNCYPIIIKAASGGGGRGMENSKLERGTRKSIELTQQESAIAFGDSTVYMEKFLENPRHIEVQVLADRHGNVLHLGDRDCSLQRRHQKLLKKLQLSTSMKKKDKKYVKMYRCMQQLNYVSAGTEFLYEENNFYFIEMNTRIQVEHPCKSESVTDLDLVKLQLRIARDEELKSSKEI